MEEAGGIAALGIDWKIFLAQLINFVIVFWLLSRFVFKPLAKVLEQRRRRVENSIKTAQQIEEEKEVLNQKVSETMEKAQHKAQTLIGRAEKTMKDEQARTRAQAETQSAKLIAEANRQIAQMKSQTKQELIREIGMLVVCATQKITESDLPEETKNKVNERVITQIKND